MSLPIFLHRSNHYTPLPHGCSPLKRSIQDYVRTGKRRSMGLKLTFYEGFLDRVGIEITCFFASGYQTFLSNTRLHQFGQAVESIVPRSCSLDQTDSASGEDRSLGHARPQSHRMSHRLRGKGDETRQIATEVRWLSDLDRSFDSWISNPPWRYARVDSMFDILN